MKVTEEITRAIRSARDGISEDKFFICHLLMDALDIEIWTEKKPEVVLFVLEAIGGDTFNSWFMDRYFETCLKGVDYLSAAIQGREAWLSKLLYLIDECFAVELFPSGSYKDRYGFFRHANGEVQFDKELQV